MLNSWCSGELHLDSCKHSSCYCVQIAPSASLTMYIYIFCFTVSRKLYSSKSLNQFLQYVAKFFLWLLWRKISLHRSNLFFDLILCLLWIQLLSVDLYVLFCRFLISSFHSSSCGRKLTLASLILGCGACLFLSLYIKCTDLFIFLFFVFFLLFVFPNSSSPWRQNDTNRKHYIRSNRPAVSLVDACDVKPQPVDSWV